MLLSIHNLRYLDPGSGSLLIQLLAAGLLGGIGILIKTFWHRIKAFFTGKKDEPLVTEEETNSDD
jgi:hypothetical protein